MENIAGCDFAEEILLKRARQAPEKAKRACTGSCCVRASVQGEQERHRARALIHASGGGNRRTACEAIAAGIKNKIRTDER